jgi:hypothetical protein
MKNFMKAPIRITMESWPRRRPWVKERLKGVISLARFGVERLGNTRGFGLGER